MMRLALADYFGDLPDPRISAKCDHRLLDIIVLAICAVLCRAETWEEIELFGESREEWLKQWLALPNGIPSHDTIERVFNKLDPQAFQVRFQAWVQAVFAVTEGQVVAIDGKTVRGAGASMGKANLHLVSAWASANGITLGQLKVNAKSNEITAIPELLKLLVLKGCIVTLDAMGCQTAIAQQIVAQKADYVLAVKQNQGQLYQHLESLFALADDERFPHIQAQMAETVEQGHGRRELRRCQVLADTTPQQSGWVGCQTLVRVSRQRQVKAKLEQETAYFISTLPPQPDHLLGCVRAHWTVENSLHWVLDVVFAEDAHRTRTLKAAENLAVLRRIALNLLKHHTAKTGLKGSLKGMRYRASLREDFLLEVLRA
jgi:predicted transposase YbfD/YdcC